MRIAITKPLFAGDELEDSPTLKTIKQLLEVIPDQELLHSLRMSNLRLKVHFAKPAVAARSTRTTPAT